MTNQTYTVLIVEDFSIDRDLFRRSLLADRNCDYHLLDAESVATGLELCRSNAIDAILIDYSLPDGDGLGFLTQLHAQSNGSSPPVVMIAGKGDESIAVQAIKLGAQDYLVKSNLTPDRLRSAVSGAIENGRLRLQLQQSNDLLRVSLDTILDCFGIYSAIRAATGEIIDFRFEYLNPAALESNQMTAADMSRGMCEVFPAVCEATGLFEKYCEVVATGVPLILDNLIYTDVFGAQHLTKAYDVRISKLNDGFVAAWRDVTVQKQAEQERDRFFDLSLDLLATGNFAGYFTRLNRAFERVLGFTNAELMAQPFLNFVHPDDRQHTTAGASGLSTGTMAIDFENRYRCKDASYRWLSWTATPSRESSSWYAVARDINDKIEPVCVAQLLAETIDSLAPPPTFSISIAPNLPTLNTKRLFLSQVFANLIGNGIKHHDSPGETLRERSDGSIQISCQECGDFYEFGITDDGPGIAPENHDKIFTIFQAVNPQNSPDSTGIGLAIVKKIIETEGGTIRLESELGKDTTFYFTWKR
jgi:PAS domain S-box-containing protein